MGWNILKPFGVWTTILRWREPLAYRPRLKGDIFIRLGIAIAFGIAATGVLLCLFANNNDPPPALAAFWALLVVGGIVAALLFNGSGNADGNIRLCEEGIVRTRMSDSLLHFHIEEASWPYNAIEQATIVRGEAIGKSFSLLFLRSQSQWEMLGLTRRISAEKVAAQLRAGGVAVRYGDSVPEHYRQPMSWITPLVSLPTSFAILVFGFLSYETNTPVPANNFAAFNQPNSRLRDQGPRGIPWDKARGPSPPIPVPSAVPAPPSPVNSSQPEVVIPSSRFGGRGLPPGRQFTEPMSERGMDGFRFPSAARGRSRSKPSENANTNKLVTGDKDAPPMPVSPTKPPAEGSVSKAVKVEQRDMGPPVYNPPPMLPGKPTELAGGPEGWQFEIYDKQRRPILGFRHRLGSWDNIPSVAELHPLFDAAEGEKAHRGFSITLAREGYVVGGIQVISGRFVNAVRVVFVRQTTEGKLDKTDFYLSDWIGNPEDRKYEVLGDGQTRIIGVCGRRGAILNALALVLDDR